MPTMKERMEFAAHLQRALPDKPAHLVVHAAMLLIRHAVTHGRLAEAECNGPGDYVNHIPYPHAGEIYAEHRAMCERRTAQIEKRIMAICATIGIVPNFGGDPRGYTVKVMLPNGASNTWGGREDGWGIPQ